jgi:rare lipoprotein A
VAYLFFIRKTNNMKIAMGKYHFILIVFACLCTTAISAAQEFGLASVYSSKFQGSRTANGEVFNHTQFTGAHRTLPFGTLIRITRTDNGKSVTVRINDRGPFVSERVTDISKAAASKLGIAKEDDEVRVKLEVISDKKTPLGSSNLYTPKGLDTPTSQKTNAAVPMPEIIEYAAPKTLDNSAMPRDYHYQPKKTEKSETTLIVAQKKNPIPNVTVTPKGLDAYGFYAVKTNTPDKKGYAVQVASLSNRESMVRIVADLKNDSFKNILVKMVKGKDGDPDYKVLLGSFDSKISADGYLKNIQKRNVKGFVVDLKNF